MSYPNDCNTGCSDYNCPDYQYGKVPFGVFCFGCPSTKGVLCINSTYNPDDPFAWPAYSYCLNKQCTEVTPHPGQKSIDKPTGSCPSARSSSCSSCSS